MLEFYVTANYGKAKKLNSFPVDIKIMRRKTSEKEESKEGI